MDNRDYGVDDNLGAKNPPKNEGVPLEDDNRVLQIEQCYQQRIVNCTSKRV